QAHPCARILETRNAAFRAGGRTLPSCFSAQANRSFVFLRSDRAVPAIASHIRAALDSGEAGFSPAFRTSERRACHAIPPPPSCAPATQKNSKHRGRMFGTSPGRTERGGSRPLRLTCHGQGPSSVGPGFFFRFAWSIPFACIVS